MNVEIGTDLGTILYRSPSFSMHYPPNKYSTVLTYISSSVADIFNLLFTILYLFLSSSLDKCQSRGRRSWEDMNIYKKNI